MSKIIGLTGKMGSGKSTAVDLIREIGYDTCRVKFAATIYRMQDLLYAEIAPAYKRPDDFVKDRKLLQFLGTDWARGLDQDVWIKLWKSEVKEALDAFKHLPDLVIIADDVRFDNEAEAIRSLGGTVIKLTSNKIEGRDVAGVSLSSHASEKGVDEKLIDAIVENNGTIDELREALRSVLSNKGDK
jgi:hypothetical protein